MRPRYRYIMRDQVKDRVTAIMTHETHPAGGFRPPVSDRPHWILLLALAAAYTAAATFSKEGLG